MKPPLVVALLWLGLVAAAPASAAVAPLPLTPPPPDLALLVPFVEAPAEKPPIAIELPPLPPVPVELPTLPPAPLTFPSADKPTAFIQSPRTLPCVGAWLGIASESLECGRARFLKGEWEDAARALEQAVRTGTDRELLREARYWLGETFHRLGRHEQADWLFRQVARDAPRPELGVWAIHSSGWTALRLRDYGRARDAFTQLLSGAVPLPLDVWGRHGLGLANYALGRYQDAKPAWEPPPTRGWPAELARDVLFWQGETLGRLGEYAAAEAMLGRFIDGGSHPLLESLLQSARLRRGWWGIFAERFTESTAAFRAYLGAPAGPGRVTVAGERDWAEAGLALALLGARDADGARDTVRGLQVRRSPLAMPVFFRLARTAVEAGRFAEAHTIAQALLGETLTPSTRAWVLLLNGEAYRAEGNRDEARTQFDLARQGNPSPPIAWQAALRVAQTNFELREFAQAVLDLAGVLSAPAPPPVRAPALFLQGEAAYHAGDRTAAATAFRRALVEFPNHPQAPLVRLGLAWTALRQNQPDVARREFLEFARVVPEHPNAPDALGLASELAIKTGDLPAARELLDRIITTYPAHPRTDFARLNRGILMVRGGQFQAAPPVLRDWLGRAPFRPLFGRAHVALGVALLGTGAFAEARREFVLAQREGLGALAALGLGATALGEKRWDEASRSLTEARETGTAAITAAAQYGLAVVAFHQGAVKELKKPALAALGAAPSGPMAPALLYVLTGIAVEEKEWPAALASAQRLVTEFPTHAAADDALERVGSAAAAARLWPVTYEAYTLLVRRYPNSPFVESSRLALAEAQFSTGRQNEARETLERFLAAAPSDPGAPSAWIMLARVRDSVGDRAGALQAYERAGGAGGGAAWTREALLGHARLLAQEKRWDQARAILERGVKSSDPEVVAEAAYAMGDTFASEGDHLAAAEYFMTAAYVAPASPAGRRALLAAGRSFAAGKDTEAAAVVYRKLLAQSDVPADLAAAARRELAALAPR